MAKYWRDAPYDGTQLLLLLALADYANDSGYCFPTQKQLAEKCRCSERHVRSLMKNFVEDGVDEDAGDNTFQTFDDYLISLGCINGEGVFFSKCKFEGNSNETNILAKFEDSPMFNPIESDENGYI